MTGPENDIFSLIRPGDALDPASVDPVVAEVRSGVEFLFRDARKRGVPADQQAVIDDAIGAGTLLAPFVVEWGFDVPYDRADQFRRWLLDNESRIARSSPAGVSYRGTYALSVGSNREAGQYRTIWTFESFNALQNLGGEVGDPTSDFTSLLREFGSFRDRERGAPQTTQFFVPAAGSHRI